MYNRNSKKVTISTISMGCDPEFFIQNKKGEIRGSEEAVPERTSNTRAQVIRDGVQVELNPHSQTCRALLAKNISQSLRLLEETLKAKDFSVSEKAVVEVPRKYLDSLSEEARALGCTPSLNSHPETIAITEADKNTNLRSAGGHIHIGIHNFKKAFPEPEFLVTILDQFVGNTAVLLDRDPGQALRRRLYGRAGEYRLPAHGLEYRTPSNFWMHCYPLMALMMGLTRMAVSLTERPRQTWTEFLNQRNKSYYTEAQWEGMYRHSPNYTFLEDWEPIKDELLSMVNVDRLRKAINDNDYDLALENHTTTEVIIEKYFVHHTAEQMMSHDHGISLSPHTFEPFRYFCEKGYKHWFPKPMFDNWRDLENQDNHRNGSWETFVVQRLIPDWNKHKEQSKNPLKQKLVNRAKELASLAK